MAGGNVVRMGMVGGGPGAFIGPVHRMAAELDGTIELVAGAFSSDPQKSKLAGRTYGIAEDRAYASYELVFGGWRSCTARLKAVAVAHDG